MAGKMTMPPPRKEGGRPSPGHAEGQGVGELDKANHREPDRRFASGLSGARRPNSRSPSALGFWQAIKEVWPKTPGQRCRAHYADFRIMPI
jgi:hypothetical protein